MKTLEMPETIVTPDLVEAAPPEPKQEAGEVYYDPMTMRHYVVEKGGNLRLLETP